MKPLMICLKNAILFIAISVALTTVIGLYSSANAAVAPVEVTQAIHGARSIGQSRLVVYGFSIYDAKLWAADDFTATNYAKESFALELRYLRNFSGTMIAERSLKEMRRLGSISDEKAAQWLDNMKKTFPSVKKGDVLVGIHQPDGTASFVLNGKPIGEMQDAEFTRLFFGIWLSAKTSEPKMRSELIGAASASGGAKK